MPLRIFPVAGNQAEAKDDFGVAKSGRDHQGNDIFADEGTPLVAVDDGEARFGTDPLGGNIAVVYADDGTHYYYAHLSAYEGSAPRRVRAGERIGYVGTTGNAQGTPPHVHFEIHPCPRGQRCAIDPNASLVSAPRVPISGPSASGGSGGLGLLPALALAGLAGTLAWTAFDPKGVQFQLRRLGVKV